MKKPKIKTYILFAFIAMLITVTPLYIMAPMHSLLFQKTATLGAGILVIYSLFAVLIWSIHRDQYKEYLIELDSTFILTYLVDGNEAHSPVYPRGLKVAVHSSGKQPECRMYFDFYDVLDKKDNPKRMYITADRFIKLEPKMKESHL